MLRLGLKVRLQRCTKFSDTLRYMGGFLNPIVRNLPPTKGNEINMFHSDGQNHVSYTGSHKRFLIYYGLCLETAGNLF